MRNAVHIELPANNSFLHVLDACIIEVLEQVEEIEDPGVTINDIRVAVQEACNNIIEHAYANHNDGRIGVTFTVDESASHLTIELHDTGSSFDFDVASVSLPDTESLNERGCGLFLLYTLMDEVIYVPKTGNNFWRLMKLLRQEIA